MFLRLTVLVILAHQSVFSLEVVTGLSREKRFLIMPPTAPTRHQFIAGIGIPLDLETIAVTSGYVFKAQYFLPTTTEDLRPYVAWDGFNTSRKKRESGNTTDLDVEEELTDAVTGRRYTRYNVPAVLVEAKNDTIAADDDDDVEDMSNEDEDFWNDNSQDLKDSADAQAYFNSVYDAQASRDKYETSRWETYSILEGIAKSNGLGGKACVLRMVCEAAEAPISHKSGILGEILHVVFTPSTSRDRIVSEENLLYHEAEKAGKNGADCVHKYPDCKKSLLNVITDFKNPFESLFSNL